jgi:hypothetical protein
MDRPETKSEGKLAVAFSIAERKLIDNPQFPDSKKCREIGTFVGEAS